MCAGCPGGRAVSPATALINRQRLKPAVRAALQHRVGNRAKITTFGGQWVLRTRTGAQFVLADAEAVAHALIDKGLVDPGVLPVGGADGAPGAPVHVDVHLGAARSSAERLVTALLADAAAGRHDEGRTLP